MKGYPTMSSCRRKPLLTPWNLRSQIECCTLTKILHQPITHVYHSRTSFFQSPVRSRTNTARLYLIESKHAKLQGWMKASHTPPTPAPSLYKTHRYNGMKSKIAVTCSLSSACIACDPWPSILCFFPVKTCMRIMHVTIGNTAESLG